SNIDILPAIIIIIRHGDTHSPASGLDPRNFRDVLEMTMPISPEKRTHHIATLLEALDRSAAHQQDIKVTVVVVVQEGSSAAHGLYDVLLGRSALCVHELL